MNGFEINKIIASIILVVLLFFGVGELTNFIFYVEKPKEPAYQVEAPAVKTASAEASGSESADIGTLLSLGTVEHGKKVFKKCSSCHVIDKGGKNKIGPALWGVLGRKSGSISSYKYSKALSGYGKVWSFKEMNNFLIKPQAYIKGTKMAYAGLKSEKDRASVILYMNTQTDNPLPKP